MSNQVPGQRLRLKYDIENSKDSSVALSNLVYASCPYRMKYEVIQVDQIISENGQSQHGLKMIPVAVNILEKYGKHLLKSKEVRASSWRSVKFTNTIFKDRVDVLKGGRDIMKLLGYTQVEEDGMTYPPNTEPDREQILDVLADLLLLRKEIEAFFGGVHPEPGWIKELIHYTPESTSLNLSNKDVFSTMGVQNKTVTVNQSVEKVNEIEKQSGEAKASDLSEISAGDTRNEICDICGDQMAMYTCKICDNKLLCEGCDIKWHKHPKRKNHHRVKLGDGTPVSTKSSSSSSTSDDCQTPPNAAFSNQQEQQRKILNHASALQTEVQVVGMQIPIDTIPKQNMPQPRQFVQDIPPAYTVKPNQQFSDPMERNVQLTQPNLNQLQMQRQFQYQQPNAVYSPPQLPPVSVPPQLPGQSMYQNMYMYPKPFDTMKRQTVNYENAPSRQVSPRDLLPQLIPDSNISEISDTSGKPGQPQLYNHPNPSFSEHVAYSPQSTPTNVRANIQQHQGLAFGRHQNTEALIGYGDKQTSNMMSSPSHHEIERRKSKLELKISTLVEEIEEIDEKITAIIHANEEFYSDPEYGTLNRRKGKYMREKRELEIELDQLNNLKPGGNFIHQQNAAKSNFQTPTNNAVGQIFYPPSLSTLFPSNQPAYFGTDPQNRNTAYYHPNVNQQYYQQGNQPYLDMNRGNYNQFVPQPQTPSQGGVSSPQILSTGKIQVTKLKSVHVPETRTEQNAFQQQSANLRLNQVANASKVVGPIEMYSQSEVIARPSELTEVKEVRDFDVINDMQEFTENFSKPEDKKIKLDNEIQQLNLNQSTEDKGLEFLVIGPPTPPPLDTSALRDQLLSDHHAQRWQCEHCTYINEPGPRICVMCNKTSDNPKVLDVTPSEEGEKFPPNDRQEQLELFEQKITADQDRVYQEKQKAQRSFEENERKRSQNPNKPLDNQKIQEPAQKKLSPNFVEPEARGSASQLIKTKSDENKNRIQTENRESSPLSSNNSASSSMFSSGVSPQTSSEFAVQKLDFSKTLDDINERRRIEKMAIDGRDTVNMLKNADKDGIDIDDMAVAVRNADMENVNPLQWFKERWENMLDSLVARADLAGRNAEENEIGQMTIKEARRALRDCNGNINEAVITCVERRKQLFALLHESGPFAREDILKTMYECQGDEEEALTQLQMKYLLQFYERMWDNNLQGAAPNLLYHPMTPDHCLSVSNSVVSHASFQAIVKNKDTPLERRIRMVMIEGKLQSWGRGESVIKILDCDIGDGDDQLDCSLEDIVEAVRNCGDRDSSLIYLKQECQCCLCDFPMSKIRSFSTCQCKICADCVKQNFEVAIKDKHIRNWTCPICSLPNVEDEDVAERYFSFLSLMLQTMLDQEMLELYQTKLRDWHLQKDPNFRWCSHCGNGFLFTGQNLKMTCPQCHLHTCFQCKNMWESQHEDLTCEQFEQWKIDNDPENQAFGLACHLEINGIDCPSCKMKYSLAKGGCMHFRCPQCGHEFCSGCSYPFFQKGMCNKYAACKRRGLHCHHPRDCFFYLRDNDVNDLQKLLQDYNVRFNREPPEGQEDKEHCPVMEQKEYDMGKKDEPCGKDVQDGHAGVCVIHYKEYLVTLINKNKVDPVSIMSSEDMKILIQRKEKDMPSLKSAEDPKSYRKRLLKFIKTNFPLRKDS